mmetsp:Transcript_9928/g.23319  ORF Transcript_9928/g.23319 Transcript_9928/m.23319 type:complete len:212 (-) Transcript_9928:695-1330(-)
MADALGIGGKARVYGPRRAAGNLAELGELPVVADGQDQVAVAGLEGLVGDDVLVRIAHAARYLAAAQIVAAQVGQHRELGVQQRHVDDLALAGGVPVAQSCQDGDRGVEAGEQVCDGHADLLRTAAGQVVALAGHAHQPAHALDRVVIAGPLGIGTGLAETGDGADHQARMLGKQAVGVEPVAREVADLEVLHQHVHLPGELAHDGLARGL